MIHNFRAIIEKGFHNFLLAFRSLWLHRMRTFLSVTGIIVGTGAVIALMSYGEGSMRAALADIERMGATNIIIRSQKPVDESVSSSQSFFIKYGLTPEDYERFQNISTVIQHVPLRVFKQEIRYLGRMHQGRVVGTTSDYAKVHQFEVASGRFLTPKENEEMKNNAVLGHRLAQDLFPLEDPLGKTVTIGRFMYRVVGVLAYRMPTGGTGGSLAAEDFNDDMYIPLNTCNRRFGDRIYIRAAGSRTGEEVALHQVTLTVRSMDDVRQTGEIVEHLLRRYHRKQMDWAVTIPLDRLEQAKRTKARMQVLLAIIGGISLLVGGIGIMNIMLATVTERIREIGIRRALGAKRRDIASQFLIEAVSQTAIGGVLGIAMGLISIVVFPPIYHFFTGENIPVVLHVPSIFISVASAIVVGVAAGGYPAYRAAKLDPIEALRHE